MVKLAKAAKKQAPPKKKAPPPPKDVEEESSEDEEEEEQAPPAKAVAKKKKAAPAKAVKNGKAAAKQESDDDDEESEEEAPPPKKATPAKAAAPAKKAAPAEESEEEDEDDEDDESEEEPPPPPKKTPAKATKKAAPAAKQESEEDDDDDDGEEEMDTTPAPKKAGMVKAKEESEEEDDDEEDDEEEEEETPVTPAKRKAETKKEKETPPAKKAKTDGEGFSLFLGNLNHNKDFDEIKSAIAKFFSKEGLEIQDVRVGGTKKFGYVDFASEEELQKALGLNGKKLMGQPVKLDKAKSKENSQDSKKERDSRTLFVKNLPYSVTQEELKEIFDQAVDIRIPMGNSGSSRGIAYLEFKSEAIAEKAMEEAQGSDVQGRSIIIDFTGEKSQKGGRATAAANKVLVVNNLAFTANEDALQSVFEKAVSIRIPQNNGRPKGFAFLEFENVEDAKEALENCNNTEIEGRSIRLEFSQSERDRSSGGGRGGSGPTKTLFVKGLSEDTTDHSLKEAFDGAVNARIVTDRDTGSSKGFGFVDFDSEEDCKAAKEAMDDGEIDGNRVTLDYAKPKGEGGRGGGRGGFGGGFGGRGGGRGGFGGRGGGRGGGFRGGRGGRGGGGFRGGRGGGRGGFGDKPQGKKMKFDD
uniref:Nucleolin n=1 Tax=Cyprinus carpio TaxID=7962 RepID=A0A8C1ZFP4_CYPCA